MDFASTEIIKGTICDRFAADKSVSRTGQPIQRALPTKCLMIEGFGAPFALPLSTLSEFEGSPIFNPHLSLPIPVLGSGQVIVNIEDFCQRFQISDKKRAKIAADPAIIPKLLRERAYLPDAVEAFQKLSKHWKHHPKQLQDAEIYSKIPFEAALTPRILMKIIRIALRKLETAETASIELKIESVCIIAAKNLGNDPLTLFLWSGSPIINCRHPAYIAQGSHSNIQRIFHLNSLTPMALKVPKSIVDHQSIKTEVRLLGILQGAGHIPGAVTAPMGVLTLGKHLVPASIWNRYQGDLCDLLKPKIELPHGPLQNRSRLELLKAIRSLWFALAAIEKAKIVHGDISVGNILVKEDSMGRLVLDIADLGGSRHYDEFHLNRDNMLWTRTPGTTWNIGHSCKEDIDLIRQTALEAFATFTKEGGTKKFHLLKKLYFKAQATRDVLGLALASYWVLGYRNCWDRDEMGYVDFTTLFQPPAGFSNRLDYDNYMKVLYGEELYDVFRTRLLTPDLAERWTAKQVLALLDDLLDEAGDPETDLHTLLQQPRPFPLEDTAIATATPILEQP